MTIPAGERILFQRTMSYVKDDLVETTEKPDVENLKKELQESWKGSYDNRWFNYSRISNYENLYFAQFHTRQDSGLVPDTPDAKPFPGATNSECRLVQNYHTAYLALLKKADKMATFRVDAVGQQDTAISPLVEKYMNYQIRIGCRDNWESEIELMKSYAGLFGWSAAHLHWNRQLFKTEIEVTAQTIHQETGVDISAQTPDIHLIHLIAKKTGVHPELVEKMLAEILQNGRSRVPITKLVKDQPSIRALKPYMDILVSVSDDDFPEESRIIFRIERYTIPELQNKVNTEGWRKKWVDEAQETINQRMAGSFRATLGGSRTGDRSKDNRVEIVQAYSKRMGKGGVQKIYRTVFSMSTKSYALHEEIQGFNGEMPFIFFRYDGSQKSVFRSTGIGERGRDLQNRMKRLQDLIHDRQVTETYPAVVVRGGDMFGDDLDLSPGGVLNIAESSNVDFMKPPSGSINLNASLQEFIQEDGDRIFACYNARIPTMETQDKRQLLADNYLEVKTRLFRKIWQLAKEFESDETWSRITEAQFPMPRGADNFDFNMICDIRQEDPEFASGAVKEIANIAMQDQTGTLNKALAVKRALHLISPALAQEMVTTDENAQRKIYDEVNSVLMGIALGNPAPIKRESELPDAEMRIQFVQQIMAQNPKYQQLSKSDPDFQAKLKQYTDNLTFAIQQQTNQAIGRTGAKPV